MGKTIKKIVSPLTDGLTEKVNPQIAKKGYFDIAKEVKPAQQGFQTLVDSSTAAQGAVAPTRVDVLKQMGQAALGQGPSLAEAQMKAAQDRNLAQQLALIQGSRGGNAAMQQRQLAQSMTQSGRALAQDAGVARLQERDSFLQAANTADQGLRADLQSKLNVDLMPKQSLQNWEMARVGAVNQAQQMNAASQNAVTGAVIGGAAQAGAAALGKPPGMANGGYVSQGSTGVRGGQMASNRMDYNNGGEVKGPGTETSDSVAANLSDGEFVVKAAVVKQPGILQALKKLNSGKKLAPKDVQALGKVLTVSKKPKKDA